VISKNSLEWAIGNIVTETSSELTSSVLGSFAV
jgi:hypothetical protein